LSDPLLIDARRAVATLPLRRPLLRLPLWAGMTRSDVERVVDGLTAALT
jgi:dTDP-4-amino-4,6-dideoxygalactose transaminase